MNAPRYRFGAPRRDQRWPAHGDIARESPNGYNRVQPQAMLRGGFPGIWRNRRSRVPPIIYGKNAVFEKSPHLLEVNCSIQLSYRGVCVD